MKTKMILILLFAFVQFAGFTQTTKPVVTYYDYYKTKIHEKANVLASNPTIFHGSYKEYGQNTVVMEEGVYNNGKKIGIWHYRNESDGLEYKTETYNNKGELHGEVIERNGKSKNVKHFKNGNADGSQKAWNEAGILVKDYTFVNGVKQGKQSEYDGETGKPIIEAYFDSLGKKKGTWKYYEDGFLWKEKNFDKDGMSIIYDKSGAKSMGVLDGYDYKFDQWSEYNAAGVLIRQGEYNNSKKMKEWKIFDDSGVLIKTEVYDYGQLISTK